MNWLPWAWLAALLLAIGALFVGAQGDEADPERRFSFRSIRLIRILPSLGFLWWQLLWQRLPYLRTRRIPTTHFGWSQPYSHCCRLRRASGFRRGPGGSTGEG